MNIGSKLRQKRVELGLSLKDIQDKIRIREKYLESLENDDVSSLPSLVTARGFLKNYADFLQLPTSELLAEFDQNFSIDNKGSLAIPDRDMHPKNRAQVISGNLLSIWESFSPSNRKRIVFLIIVGIIAFFIMSVLKSTHELSIQEDDYKEEPVVVKPVQNTPENLETDRVIKGVKVEFRTVTASQILVIRDGVAIMNTRLEPDQYQNIEARKSVTLKITPGNGVRLSVDGKGFVIPGTADKTFEATYIYREKKVTQNFN